MYTPTIDDRVHGSAQLRRRQTLGRTIARSLGHLDIRGLEQVPASGPVVLAMNHLDYLDGPLIFGFVRRPVTCLVKSEAFTPRMAPVLRGAGQIAVSRGGIEDVAAVRLCLRILEHGGVIGVFPEGRRGDGRVHQVKPGAAYLALRTGAAVVPVAFHGTNRLARDVGRPSVRIDFGPPVHVPRVDPHRPLNRRIVAAEAERLRVVLADLVRASGADTAERDHTGGHDATQDRRRHSAGRDGVDA